MPSRSIQIAMLSALLGATACSSPVYQRVVVSNPPDATIYINGVKAGKGDRQLHDFDFTEVGRVYVQAVHPDYEPEFRWFTEQKMRDEIAANLKELKISMRQRQ